MSTTCPTATTGLNGNVLCGSTRLARITNWTITASTGETTFADSDSSGYTQRAPTRREATGSVDFKYDNSFEMWERVREGECCALTLFVDLTHYWYIPVALIQNLTINVNIEDLEVIDGSFDFASSGIYYAPGEAGAPAVALPAGPS